MTILPCPLCGRTPHGPATMADNHSGVYILKCDDGFDHSVVTRAFTAGGCIDLWNREARMNSTELVRSSPDTLRVRVLEAT